MYELKPSQIFLEQIEKLTKKSKSILKEKLLLLKENPFRFKKLNYKKYLVFRIRFKNNQKAKRLIYLVEKEKIFLICILDRDKNYKDLKKYLK
jgi:mRNA-degrading endonuclease RelE of RelBE toxin-antitoxin system